MVWYYLGRDWGITWEGILFIEGRVCIKVTKPKEWKVLETVSFIFNNLLFLTNRTLILFKTAIYSRVGNTVTDQLPLFILTSRRFRAKCVAHL